MSKKVSGSKAYGTALPARMLAAVLMGFRVSFGPPSVRRKVNRLAPMPHRDRANLRGEKRTPTAFELDLSDHQEQHVERIEASSLREAVAKVEAIATDAGHWIVPSERRWIR